ncbi:hypothetical protein Vafri_17099, partial [Volvox africanus]
RALMALGPPAVAWAPSEAELFLSSANVVPPSAASAVPPPLPSVAALGFCAGVRAGSPSRLGPAATAPRGVAVPVGLVAYEAAPLPLPLSPNYPPNDPCLPHVSPGPPPPPLPAFAAAGATVAVPC